MGTVTAITTTRISRGGYSRRTTRALMTMSFRHCVATLGFLLFTCSGPGTGVQGAGPRPLTSAEKKVIVDEHNRYRRLQGSSDMEYMMWDEYLAEMANEYAAKCVWDHGQPYRTCVPFKSLGQNMHYTTGSFDAGKGMKAWYDEISDYSYSSGACSGVCGHYTQLVWASSNVVGCAVHNCATMDKSKAQNANLFVCNYGPPGNFKGKKPYAKGTQCKSCSSTSGQCSDGLCRDCQTDKAKCSCVKECYNCGTINRDNCTCSCLKGYMGHDCSQECKNLNSYCDNPSGGWPPSWCSHDTMGDTVRENCPLMCKSCEALTSPASCGTPKTTASFTFTGVGPSKGLTIAKPKESMGQVLSEIRKQMMLGCPDQKRGRTWPSVQGGHRRGRRRGKRTSQDG